MQRFFRTRLGAFVLFLIFIVLSQLIEWGLGTLALRLHLVDISDRTWRPSLFIAFEGVTALAALGASFAIVAIGRRSMRELGYAGNGAGKLIVAGSALGAAAPMLLIAAIVALGGFTFGAFAMHGTQLAAYTLAWLVAMFGIGLAEELTFRGPAFLLLGETIGLWPAAIVASAIFAALHYFGKPGENLADALSVGLLGLFMAFTVIRTGSIWFAVGFHALFDDVALYVLGAPNSGNHAGEPLPTRLLTGGYHGPAWLTGGKLGIEASWLVFPIIALLFVGFHFATRGSRRRLPITPAEAARA
jgi:membrane protease YdiL (CAAX protease family)